MKRFIVNEKCLSVLGCEHLSVEENIEGKLLVEWESIRSVLYRAKEILGSHIAELSPIERKLYEEIDRMVT